MKQPNLRLLLPVFLGGCILLALLVALPRLGLLRPAEPGVAQGIAALDALDFPAARAIFTRLAGQGDAAAETWLGHMEEEGLGAAADGAKAADWYKKAAATGSADAERRLGELYLHGAAAPQDAGAARHWLALAAAQGDRRSERELGELYATGLGGARDAGRAYGWLAMAASAGDAQAARERDRVATGLSASAAEAAEASVQAALRPAATQQPPAPHVAQRVPAAPNPAGAG